MTARASVALSRAALGHRASCPDPDVEKPSMSSRKFSDRREVLTYRQHFAFVWQRFVTENFDSPAHAAHVFQVDATTADNWWKGVNAPSGWVVARAISDPALRPAALSALAGEA
jgi:hypothetical protein